MRIFKNRSEVNKTDVLEGRLPESKGEIAADRLYLENNGLTIGDELAGLKITGAVALSDYSALFKNNTDMMLDANKFCVAVVTPETFDEIDETFTCATHGSITTKVSAMSSAAIKRMR